MLSFNTLKSVLSKTSSKIISSITTVFTHKKLNLNTLSDLENALLMSDVGALTTSKIIDEFKAIKFKKEVNIEEIKLALASVIYNTAFGYDYQDLPIASNTLNVIMICGVNGNGKTTVIGKLAAYFKAQGNKISIAACDTFRAAALEQLTVWSERANTPIISYSNADPASVAFKSIQQSINDSTDILLIDTAGRLHNNDSLMHELNKIEKVIQKQNKVNYFSLLTLDATTGQNAFNQVEKFKHSVNINGLIINKLDSSAKAGVVLGISEKFKIPIYFIGTGEKLEDIIVFNSKNFIHALLGIT